MAVTATNLIAGPARAWVAVFGTAEPVNPTTDPGVGWREVGGTQDGVTLNVEQEFFQLEVDQVNMVPESRRTSLGFSIATNMAEPTLENLATALNELQSAVTEDATNSARYLEPTVGDSTARPNYSAVLIRGQGPDGKPRDVIARKALNTESVESAYKKDGQKLIPVSFMAHWVSDSVPPFRVADSTA